MSHGGGDDGLPEEHEEHVNHEAWVIPYADLLTLLMAMFIALFAMSSVDMDKFKELSIGFNEALGGGELSTGVFDPTDGGQGVLDGEGSGLTDLPGGEIGPDRQPSTENVLASLLQARTDMQAAHATEKESLEGIKREIEEQATAGGFGTDLTLEQTERGLNVTVVTDRVLFASASAELNPDGLALLRLVGDALKTVDNDLVIEGHTDARPIRSTVYPSNWELSTARAGAVARFFEGLGIPSERLFPAGRAATEPIGDNATADGQARNRRVVIIVESELVEETLQGAGLTDEPVTEPDPLGVHVDGGIDPVDPGIHP